MLPSEIVVAIADQLETGRDYYNLAQTCKTNHRLLGGRRWKDIHIRVRPYRLESSSPPATRCKWIRDGAIQIISEWQMTRTRHRQCPLSPCEACEIEGAILPVNAYLDCRATKISQPLRELTLSGWLPQTLHSMNEDAPRHTIETAGGMCALRPEILNIELHWASSSPLVLLGFELTRLRSLKIPVRASVDCHKIGVAFMSMPNLANLTITELSDSQDFVRGFRHLGDGIMALSSSLRSLDITIVNSKPAADWQKDETFVEPKDAAFFFKEFFPEPSCNRVEALVRARYNDPREPLDVNILQSSKGQLGLERIRLKYISLPWWAFQTVFNPETIKELDLPTCQIAPNVWNDLGKYAHLHKLANINYEILSGPFLDFLSTQTNLHLLSFARPPDIYIVSGTRLDPAYISADDASFAVTEEAPHLGPGTGWGRARARDAWLLQFRSLLLQHEHTIESPRSSNHFENIIGSLRSYNQCQYPGKSDFVQALSNKTSLKHLVLPADMFDITPKFMTTLTIELPALESIEWGFDYACPILRACFIHDFLPSHSRLKKITFLSLNRPRPLSDFDASDIYSVFTSGSLDLAPAHLKYVRYRDLNCKSYRGNFTRSDVYYHRESMVDGTWWLRIPARKADNMFENARTPNI